MASATEIDKFTYDAIDKLRLEVERKVGYALRTPRDFQLLSNLVEDAAGVPLSISTIKRLWKYIESPYAPSHHSLSLLAKYVGFSDWEDFCRQADVPTGMESSYTVGKCLLVENLSVGKELEICWAPDRICRIKYLGGNCFRILDSINAKLQVGDTFTTSIFAVGHPLYATNVMKAEGETHELYIAGKEKGLTRVTVLPEK